MAVPGASANYLKNTTGGAFAAQKQGGTIIGNGETGSTITKAFLLKDATDDTIKSYGVPERAYPSAPTGGMYGTQKILSGGTFSYQEAGQYVIRTVSTTISGVSTNAVLIPGNSDRPTVARLKHDFGVRLLAKWRANEFSYMGVLANGSKIPSRLNWLNSAGTQAEAPVTATDLDMFDPTTGATSANSDSAANPTRAVPGELVLKVDFVDTNFATSGDFYDYKPITGM